MKFLEIRGFIEAVDDILSWVEARLHAADGIQKCQMSSLGRNHSYCLCRRRKGLSELKKRLLEEIKFGSAGTFSVLTACINVILENLPPFGQDLCQIGFHQCTVMTDFMDRFYKKTPTPTTFAFYNFLSFTLASMSADSEI